jgi:hypothetical protein
MTDGWLEGGACGKISLDGGNTGTGLLKGVGTLVVGDMSQGVVF